MLYQLTDGLRAGGNLGLRAPPIFDQGKKLASQLKADSGARSSGGHLITSCNCMRCQRSTSLLTARKFLFAGGGIHR